MNDGLFSLLYIDPPTAVGGSAQDENNDFHWNFTKKHIPEMKQLIKENFPTHSLVFTFLTYNTFSFFREKWIAFLSLNPDTLQSLLTAQATTYSFFFWVATTNLHQAHPTAVKTILGGIITMILGSAITASNTAIQLASHLMTSTFDFIAENSTKAAKALINAYNEKNKAAQREEEEARRREARRRKDAEDDKAREDAEENKVREDWEDYKARRREVNNRRAIQEGRQLDNLERDVKSLQVHNNENDNIREHRDEMHARGNGVKVIETLNNVVQLATWGQAILQAVKQISNDPNFQNRFRHLSGALSAVTGVAGLGQAVIGPVVSAKTTVAPSSHQQPTKELPAAREMSAARKAIWNRRTEKPTTRSARMFLPNSSAAEEMTHSEYTFLKEINGALDSIVFV
jgi:Skp family chaperone for outer membrane proteins